MAVIDLSGMPPEAREAEAARIVREDSLKPFDLSRDLMLRAQLLRFGPADHLLVCCMHHIACDGWSLEVFFR
jgi:hypothetical protein